MDHYVTGATIRTLREKYRMTQAELAEKLCVSDKAVTMVKTFCNHIRTVSTLRNGTGIHA